MGLSLDNKVTNVHHASQVTTESTTLGLYIASYMALTWHPIWTWFSQSGGVDLTHETMEFVATKCNTSFLWMCFQAVQLSDALWYTGPTLDSDDILYKISLPVYHFTHSELDRLQSGKHIFHCGIWYQTSQVHRNGWRPPYPAKTCLWNEVTPFTTSLHPSTRQLHVHTRISIDEISSNVINNSFIKSNFISFSKETITAYHDLLPQAKITTL